MSQAQAAFEGDAAEMPTAEISADGATAVVDVLVAVRLCASKSEARRLIEGGGVKIDDKKVESFSDALSAYTDGKEFVLAKGKKTKLKVKI